MAALIIAIFPQNSSRGNWEEQQDRTSNIIQFELGWNPHGYWLFGSLDFQSGNMISSRSRYDHFDTSPDFNECNQA